MARRVTNRTLMTITHTGTGAYDVSGAVLENGFKSYFSQLGPGAHDVWYVVSDLNNWEVGRGVYDTTPATITRDVILDGTNGPGTPVNWMAGNKFIFMDIPADWFEWLAVDFNLPQSNYHDISASVGMAFGRGHTVAGTYGSAFGRENIVNGEQGVALGRENEASVANSLALGWQSKTRYNHSLAIAAQYRAAAGDRQGGIVTPNATTTNATPQNLTFAGNFWSIPTGIVCGFSGTVTAYQFGGTAGTVGDSHAWEVGGLSKGPASTTLGTLTVRDLGGDAATSGWNVQGSSSGFSPVEVVGEADKDINWSSCLVIAEAG